MHSTDLQTLKKLEQSLTECIHTLSTEESKTDPVKRLFLIEVGGELRFAPKEPQTIHTVLAKVFQHSPAEEDFKLQLEKIKQLFASVSKETLQNEDKIVLKNLEHNLNALGNHIFIRRQHSPLAFTRRETIDQFQLCYSPQDELPAPRAITCNLPNKSKKCCWLNAALNYLASSDLYDERLCHAMKEEALEGLRKKIFPIIAAMRKNSHQAIIDSLHEELIDYLKIERFAPFLNGQQDCNDFLELLRNHSAYQLPLKTCVLRATIYKSFDDDVLKESSEDPPSTLLQMPSFDEAMVDVNQELEKEEYREGITNYLIFDDGVWQRSKPDDPAICFQSQMVITQLPDRLELGLTKGKCATNEQQATVSQQKLPIDDKGLLVLNEYAPVYRELNNEIIFIDARLKATCTYKVITAIERLGKRVESGHFVTYIRDANNAITKYSDRTITPHMPESVWQQALLLQLECVERKAHDQQSDES
ncbi:MAG: hypothetical protein JSR46_12235 [Verrucomicrobia bacterium]|nr:hypothetical protein [Verrucomicrobiota bacterium]